MSTVRLRRLQADYEQLQAYVTRHGRLQLIQAEGTPPERYQLEYRINSLRQHEGELQEVASHLVEITLPRNYPRNPPQCRMLTPVFHPNIAPHAICVGDHWSAGEPLSSIVARIGEMLAYQSYNTKSPLNGEAARWVDQNVARLPLDAVSMMPDESARLAAGPATTGATMAQPAATGAATKGSATPTRVAAPAAGSSATPPPAAPSASATSPPSASHIVIKCPGCGAHIRVPGEHAGKQARCPRCSQVMTVPIP